MFSRSLEVLLHSKIVTAQSMSLLEHSPRPTDETWEYDKPHGSFETDLFRQLKPLREVEGLNLKASFAWAWEACSTLGKWCSDRLWHYDLSESEVHKILGRYEKSHAYRSLETAEERENAVSLIRQAGTIAANHQFQDLSATTECLSAKVLLLHQKLSQFYFSNEKTRCIVFVEQRKTARILADVFAILRIPGLRPGILVGVSGNTIGGQTETWKQHEKTMDEFRAGIVNCLFGPPPMAHDANAC
jgi:endoribonuclease Dicer